MDPYNEFLTHEEHSSWVAQYIIWSRQFIPKDAEFKFDETLSAFEVLHNDEQRSKDNSSIP